MKDPIRIFLVPVAMLGVLVLMVGATRHPGLFANERYLGGLIALELVVVCLWRFEKLFFPVTIGCFLLAGTGLPLSIESRTLRWPLLGIGALAGLVLWIRSRNGRHFDAFHLVGLFCILAASASASVSDSPGTALLKVLSLFLLFMYAATGARVALESREQSFVNGLVLACEVVAYAAAACYFFLGYELFGNYNALGAILGVVVTPILLWAALVAKTEKECWRRYFGVALCGALLYLSVCRAAILGDAVLVVFLTIALRRPGLLVRAAFAATLFLEIMAVVNPSHVGEVVESLSGRFLYKNELETQHDLLGSRQTPWQDTVTAVKLHPWFGTGFGTSKYGDQAYTAVSIVSDKGENREHGSSYLALIEYLGLLGLVPFVLLLFLLTRATAKVFGWLRRTGDPSHYAVPFAMVVVAGLVEAGFEDWLFAAGSYLCVFFWVAAFLLVELASRIRTEESFGRFQPNAPLAPALAIRQPTT